MKSPTSKGPKVTKALKSINNIRNFFAGLDNINRGGCGIAALGIYDTAKKNGLKPQIVFAFDDISVSWFGVYDIHLAYKKKETNQIITPAHVYVKIGNLYYDARGVYKNLHDDVLANWAEVDEKVTRKHLVNALKDTGGWNYCFSREKYYNDIKTKVGIDLLNLK